MSQEIVLITGTSSGLGMCAAAMLVKHPSQKYKVYAAMRNTAKKDELLKKAGECGEKNLVVIQLDVCSDDSVHAAVKDILDKEGRIDVLVNNAGIGLLGVLEEQSWEAIMNTFNTNVFGVFRMLRAIVPSMKKKKKGRIINISSIGGLLGLPFNTVYGSTKYALEGITECLAPQLAQFNIHVSAVEPGPISTQFAPTAFTHMSAFQPKDEPTKALFDKFVEGFNTTWMIEGVLQSGDECAEYVLKAIVDEKPQVHYLTNKTLEESVKVKFNDMTGEECLKRSMKYIS
ncbi:retinol dehydrogenase 8-like [Dendronephthya gigantea]|uniref:retinol dehydrogenase 8-like n=1 Tax=Dendronephthya gigantea TaxID=151771 RepID=UPI00106C956A|nr:retinol dehydrogenase 8-like [Dendronephthya gigantea]